MKRFLKVWPKGHQPADSAAGAVPTYHFWLRLNELSHPPIPMAGGIGLRIAADSDTLLYYGHAGYHVYPPARGRHYAERSSRLLAPLARMHGLQTLWITCNPDNFASRRTCERLGAELAEIIPVPAHHPLHALGDREKCRYRWEIG